MNTNKVRKRSRSQKIFAPGILDSDGSLEEDTKGADFGREKIQKDEDTVESDGCERPSSRYIRAKDISRMATIGRSRKRLGRRRRHHKMKKLHRGFELEEEEEEEKEEDDDGNGEKEQNNRRRIFPGQRSEFGGFPCVASKRISNRRRKIPSFHSHRDHFDTDFTDDEHFHLSSMWSSSHRGTRSPRHPRTSNQYHRYCEDDESSLGNDLSDHYSPPHHRSPSVYFENNQRPHHRSRRKLEKSSSSFHHHTRSENISVISNEENANESPRYFRHGRFDDDKARYSPDECYHRRSYGYGNSRSRRPETLMRRPSHYRPQLRDEDDDGHGFSEPSESTQKQRRRAHGDGDGDDDDDDDDGDENSENDEPPFTTVLHPRYLPPSHSDNNLAFSYGDRTEPVDIHVMVMPAQSHEQNTAVVDSFLPGFAYTAYPSKKREFLAMAYAGNFRELSRAVADMFERWRNGLHVHVEFVDADDLKDSSKGPLTLVVGCHENEITDVPQTSAKLTMDSVVVIKQGPFEGGKGVIKRLRGDKALIQMHEDQNTVTRWVRKVDVEAMETQQLLQHLSARPQSTSVSENVNSNSAYSLDNDMVTALQNEFFDGEDLARVAPSAASLHDAHDSTDRHAPPKRKFSHDGLSQTNFMDIEDHLSGSFDPALDDGEYSALLRESRDQFVEEDSKRLARQSKREHEHEESSPEATEPKDDEQVKVVECEVPRVAATAASIASKALEKHQQQQLLLQREEEEQQAPRETDTPSTTPDKLESKDKVPEREHDEERKMRQPPQAIQEFAGRLTRAQTDARSDKYVTSPHRGPPKKRRSVGTAVACRERPPPAPHSIDTPTEIKAKVFVNTVVEESCAQSVEHSSSEGVTTTQVAAGALVKDTSLDDGAGAWQQSFSVKRNRGRPRKIGSHNMSSAWKFLESLSVLELKDKLKQLRLPSTGNKDKLFEKLANAIEISESTPIEALPDFITGFQIRLGKNGKT